MYQIKCTKARVIAYIKTYRHEYYLGKALIEANNDKIISPKWPIGTLKLADCMHLSETKFMSNVFISSIYFMSFNSKFDKSIPKH